MTVHEQPLSLADVTEDLFARFAGRFQVTMIARVVRHCHREQEITRSQVPLQTLETLCLQRLDRMAPQPTGEVAAGMSARRPAGQG